MTPDPIAAELARLQAEQDAAIADLRATYRAKFADLHAQWIRERQQRSAA